MKYSGVFRAKKKDGTEYYRASITYKEKHISLGSFPTEKAAGAAYAFSREYLDGEEEYLPEEYEEIVLKYKKNNSDKENVETPHGSKDKFQGDNYIHSISFEKWIMLLNLKKTGMYCKNPVYLYGKYFVYYLDRHTILKFGTDQFFFFRTHKLQKRGGHIFYSDYGMQCGLLARFGVKNYAVEGRDYVFKNGDSLDFRFGNLVIINKYTGVFQDSGRVRKKYDVRIHLRGDLKVGSYNSEVEAAVAYNKAADSLEEAIRRRNSFRKIETEPMSQKNSVKKHEVNPVGKWHTTNVENKILSPDPKECTIYGSEGFEKEENEVYKRRINIKKIRDKKWKKNTSILCSKMIKIEFFHAPYSIRKEDEISDKTDEKHYKTRLYRYRRWKRNYIEGLSKKEYIEMYERIDFSKNFKAFLKKM